jgi:hypothetical protein
MLLVGWPDVAPAFAQLCRKHKKSERQDQINMQKLFFGKHQKSGVDSKNWI